MCWNQIGITAQHTAARVYTEVPGEAIWWHRVQDKLSAVGALPRTLLGELTALPRHRSWWGRETGCPLSNYPLLSALWISLLLFPHSKIVPLLIQAGVASTPLNLISATTETCVFLYVGWHLQFLHSSAGSGFSYGLYLDSS